MHVSGTSPAALFTHGCARCFHPACCVKSTKSINTTPLLLLNVQGKIKGSYTPDKMLEFCRRGTLSSTQLLLGIDQNLPYLARQVCCGTQGSVGVR